MWVLHGVSTTWSVCLSPVPDDNSPSEHHTLTPAHVPAQGSSPSAQMWGTAGFYTSSFSQDLTSPQGSGGVTLSTLPRNLLPLQLNTLLSKTKLYPRSLWFGPRIYSFFLAYFFAIYVIHNILFKISSISRCFEYLRPN